MHGNFQPPRTPGDPIRRGAQSGYAHKIWFGVLSALRHARRREAAKLLLNHAHVIDPAWFAARRDRPAKH